MVLFSSASLNEQSRKIRPSLTALTNPTSTFRPKFVVSISNIRRQMAALYIHIGRMVIQLKRAGSFQTHAIRFSPFIFEYQQNSL